MSFDQLAILTAWIVLALMSALMARILHEMTAGLRTVFAGGAPSATPPAVGTVAPEFRARLLDGESVTRDDLLGRETLLIFASPTCPTCRREMRSLMKLGRTASERVGLRLLLVSDHQRESTVEWLDTMKREDGVTVDVPVVIAPSESSNLIPGYNPPKVTPSFCFVTSDGMVGGSGRVGSTDWVQLRTVWEGPSARRTFGQGRG